MLQFLPEGDLIDTAGNREALASIEGLERARREGRIVEGLVTRCDSDLCLHVDLGAAEGILEPDEAVFCRPGEKRKDVALITRVGKPASVIIKELGERRGRPVAILSRRAAGERCQREYLSRLRPGDLIFTRVTHLEPFGAFLDLGCGVTSLLPVDAVSVSRISHPRDRLAEGQRLPVAVRTVDPESGRISASLRELLGTWEENAAGFDVGQTVPGILRSVEPYGAFIELRPNLSGLAELRECGGEDLAAHVGEGVSVYVKSISPERMKIKLVLIDLCRGIKIPRDLPLFVDPAVTPHLSRWLYSPPESKKTVETIFDLPQ